MQEHMHITCKYFKLIKQKILPIAFTKTLKRFKGEVCNFCVTSKQTHPPSATGQNNR